jgi:hypothetical protein
VIGAKSGSGIHCAGVPPSHEYPLLGAGNEERAAAMKDVKTGKINVGAIHNVERICFGHDGVEYVDVMHFSVGNLNESGDWAAYIQERV